MTERYFEGVKFTVPKPIRKPTIITIFNSTNSQNVSERRVEISEGDEQGVLEPSIPVIERLWSRKSVISNYEETMAKISGYLGVELPLHNRHIYFVSKDRMIPKDLDDRISLVERYGPYILDGIAGDLTRVYDGSFRIRLGYAGEKNPKVSQETVLETLAHEYGHSLGENLAANKIENVIFEEMKADAFAALFMSYYMITDEYLMDGEYPDRLHDLSKHRIGQLQTLGVSEEEALAHLTGRPFGEAGPDDWRSHLALK